MRMALLAVTLLAAGCERPGEVAPGVPKVPKLRVAVISQSANNWPVWVAEQKGFFTEEGAEVEIVVTGDSAGQLEGLANGEFEITHQAADHFVRSIEEGRDFVVVLTISRPIFDLIVRPGIESYADLEGRTIALDNLTTGYWLLYKKVLEANGLAPGDYTIQPDSGGPLNRMRAVKEDRAQFTYMNPPQSLDAVAEGFTRLTSLSDHYPDFPGSSVGVRRAWAAEYPDDLVAYLRGYIRSTDWLLDPANRNEAIEIAARYVELDAASLPGSYDAFVGRGLVRSGTLSREGYEQVVELLVGNGVVDAPGGEMEKYADPSYQQRALAELAGR